MTDDEVYSGCYQGLFLPAAFSDELCGHHEHSMHVTTLDIIPLVCQASSTILRCADTF